MLRVVALIGLSQLVTSPASAWWWWPPSWKPVPEIDGSATITVVALVAGLGVLAYNKFKR
jgi:hypothetical protein